ncbi:MAG: 2OG-Fe(II) oxygenase [Methylocella sp.]
MAGWRPYYSFDLLALGLLPPAWDAQIRSIVSERAIDTYLTGSGLTSREKRIGQRLHVRVTDGVVVRESLPWLWSLYTHELLDFSSQSFEKPLFVANLLRTTININQLIGRGAQYEWHVDSNPVTGVLFATSSEKGLGGSLVFADPQGRRSIVRPKAGTYICFDAREIPHRVSPLRRDGDRISLPMNYYDNDTDQPRPDDLDDQLYTPPQTT